MVQPFQPFAPVLDSSPAVSRTVAHTPPPPTAPSGSHEAKTEISPPPLRPAGWRFLGTAHGDFALFEAPGGIVVVDRRAAHERVWFERLQREFARGETASQRLLFALPLELDAIGSALLLEHLPFLQAHGLEVAEFGRHFFRIEAVPAWLEPSDAEIFLRDVIGLMREGRLDTRKAALADEELARLAAQKAVRLPPTVGEADALVLVARLFACRHPHTSPAGRPTHFELSKADLARRFQR
jgi:DNA mismatch repair protein MutL